MTRKLWLSDPKIRINNPNIVQHKLTNDPKIMKNEASNFKITDPTVTLWENQDIKTVIKELFAKDLTLMLKQTVNCSFNLCELYRNDISDF